MTINIIQEQERNLRERIKDELNYELDVLLVIREILDMIKFIEGWEVEKSPANIATDRGGG